MGVAVGVGVLVCMRACKCVSVGAVWSSGHVRRSSALLLCCCAVCYGLWGRLGTIFWGSRDVKGARKFKNRAPLIEGMCVLVCGLVSV